MLFSWRRFGVGASWDIGCWFVRYGSRVIMMKAPWDLPLFSEQYGFNKTLVSCRGWRLLWRLPAYGRDQLWHKLEAAE